MPKLIVTGSSYEFVPPHEGRFWPRILRPIVRRHLRSHHGVTGIEIRGAEKLEKLIRSGQGILLTPNHCRMADALVLQELSASVKHPFFFMASSHLFRGRKILAWTLRKMGAFSVYREGVDRAAVKTSIDILSNARRPLIIFPEGALSQANDRLNALMDGVSFIAHAAAKRANDQAKGNHAGTVVLPVAIKYLFKGDIQRTLEPMLERIEQRLLWEPQGQLSLLSRIFKIGHAVITLKEIEFFGESRAGELDDRLHGLIDHLLVPMEEEWLKKMSPASVISRVKELRKAIVPDMIDGNLSEAEITRRWRCLQKMELAQQMSLYPRHYLASHPTFDRLIETVERIEEGLSGTVPTPPPMTVIVQVGEPLEVPPRRSKEGDPFLAGIESQLQGMLDNLALESLLFEPSEGPERSTTSRPSGTSSADSEEK
jgi:1-acyl-sn-glycerol-3-phosphate acyltransferase